MHSLSLQIVTRKAWYRMATSDPFADGIQYLHEHVTDLRRQVTDNPTSRQTLLDVAFETMNSTIEELRVAEEEMRQQNEALAAAHDVVATWRHHYEDLFESAPDTYLVSDMDGVIREANRAAVGLLGLSKRFLKGKPLATFIPEEERQAFRRLLLEMAQAPETVEREMKIRPRRRPSVAVALTASVVRDPHGRPTGLRWLVRDLTDRNQAEAERYRLLVEEVTDYAIFLISPEGSIMSWNSGAKRILGYTEEEMRGQQFSMLFLPEERDRDLAAHYLERAEAQGRADIIGWHQRKDGSLFWGSGVLTALRDKNGSLRCYAKVGRDDTARKEEEERMAQAYAEERRIAATFQRALLPEIAEDAFPGLAVSSLYEAAWAEAQVGGDFFDAFALDGDRVALVVGDVSGKGLAAAAHTAEVKYALRAYLREAPAPDRALSRLNAFVHDNHRLGDAADDNTFVTLAVVVVHPATGAAAAAAAGAEPPLLLRAGGAAEPVTVRGGLLGMTREMDYEAADFTLAPGDTVILVTDGITEARRGRDFLDFEGMTRLAQGAAMACPVHEIGRAVLEGARAFAGGSLADDACLLLARRV